jgi:transposase InsO family protein
MDDQQIKSIEDVKNFLKGAGKNGFRIPSLEDRYGWMTRIVKQFRYLGLSKKEKGVVFQYLRKRTGYSRQQVSRLIEQYRHEGKIVRKEPRRYRFPKKYGDREVSLLVQTDNLHSQLSGPATKKILEREYQVYGRKEYQRLSHISVSHIYNLRQKKTYRHQALYFTKTHPTSRCIGERRKPQPQGKPGYIRVDSVHQGDSGHHKGVYHINTIDEVTQYQVIACVERISEAYLLPVLQDLLDQYPFTLWEFHADNGSEFINYQVAEMLQRVFIKLTKSRPRHPNDNALVESKNGSIVRKHMGYAYIPSGYAPSIHRFYKEVFNLYLNYHHPCFFPETKTDSTGKQKKVYPYHKIMTPYEKLRAIHRGESFLKKNLSFTQLDAFACQMSDNQFAERMSQAKDKLFAKILHHEHPFSASF